MGISENIKELREKHDLTQSEFGRIAGVSDKAVSTWENGSSEPRMGAIQKLADYFNIKKSDIIEDHSDLDGLTNITYPAAYPVPVLGTICAGNGVWCEDNYEGVFFVDKSIKADMCLKVHGDSMKDAEIHDGNIAFIRKTCDYENGKIYAVRINDESEAVLKIVHWSNDKTSVVLSSQNAAYPPIVENAENVSIIGECAGVYHVK